MPGGHRPEQPVATDAGVRPQGVATLELKLAAVRYPTAASRRAFYDAVLQRVQAMPGIEQAGPWAVRWQTLQPSVHSAQAGSSSTRAGA